MTIIKTASEAYAERRQQIYDEEYQKAMYELAHQGCDKCPCCGSKEFEKERKITEKKHLFKDDYWYHDKYICTECESVWESDRYDYFSYTVLSRGVTFLFAIISVMSFILIIILNSEIFLGVWIFTFFATGISSGILSDRYYEIQFELEKKKNNKEANN